MANQLKKHFVTKTKMICSTETWPNNELRTIYQQKLKNCVNPVLKLDPCLPTKNMNFQRKQQAFITMKVEWAAEIPTVLLVYSSIMQLFINNSTCRQTLLIHIWLLSAHLVSSRATLKIFVTLWKSCSMNNHS